MNMVAPLFPSLFEAEPARGTSPRADRDPAYLPTIIQLYSSKFIHFTAKAILPVDRSADSSSSSAIITADRETYKPPRTFEILSYQAVHVSDIQQPVIVDKKLVDERPNLGVWNCYFSESKDTHVLLAASALNGALHSDTRVPIFSMTIDMERPSHVFQNVTCMTQIILKHFQNRQEIQNSTDKKLQTLLRSSLPTTSITTMASTVFGQPSTIVKDHADEPSSLQGDLGLILCAILPSPVTLSTLSYSERQALRLVHYHLHRYASALNCTLLFLQDHSKHISTLRDEQINMDTKTSSFLDMMGLTVNELARIMKTIFHSESTEATLIDRSHVDDESGIRLPPSTTAVWLQQHGIVDSVELKESSVYLPDSHDDEWIESVLVRNSSCAGSWDAYNDPLWVALKPPCNTMEKEKENVLSIQGEQEWLSTLADKLSVVAFSSSSSQIGSGENLFAKVDTNFTVSEGSKNIKEGEEDVANFFDDLLKK